MGRRFICLAFVALMAVPALAEDDQPWFHVRDPLAPRDEWGVLHQMPDVRATDYASRWGARWYYYFKSRRELLRDPAYVAALQTTLKQRGYYCGPIDGVMTDLVSEAIARAQKNHLQPVTGTLTVAVRRALNLP
jgi:Putative peptidoglycan binding domain